MSNIESTKTNEEACSAVQEQYKCAESKKTYIPKSDIYETDETVFIWADMPGVDEKSLDITLEKNSLTIEGHVEDYSPPEGYFQVMDEYPVGNYKRTFTLGANVQKDGIEGIVKNGFLNLTIPKTKETAARKISISAG
jgi:HSP20 family molecular chaperone IbpA